MGSARGSGGAIMVDCAGAFCRNEFAQRGVIEGAMESVSVYSCGPCCIASSYDGRSIMMGGPDGVIKVLRLHLCVALGSQLTTIVA